MSEEIVVINSSKYIARQTNLPVRRSHVNALADAAEKGLQCFVTATSDTQLHNAMTLIIHANKELVDRGHEDDLTLVAIPYRTSKKIRGAERKITILKLVNYWGYDDGDKDGPDSEAEVIIEIASMRYEDTCEDPDRVTKRSRRKTRNSKQAAGSVPDAASSTDSPEDKQCDPSTVEAFAPDEEAEHDYEPGEADVPLPNDSVGD